MYFSPYSCGHLFGPKIEIVKAEFFLARKPAVMQIDCYIYI